MEEKINVAKILKNKSEKTILYDAMRDINVSLYVVEKQNGETNIFCDGMEKFKGCSFVYSDTGADYIFRKGMQLLKPSKEMQDWEKFAWKRGDVLMAGVDNICIFDKWNNDEYTEFDAAFVTPDYRSDVLKTKYWHKVIGEDIIKRYISKIEKNKGGTLNLETLEIEKSKFKDGDIVVYKCEIDDVPSTIFIFRGIDQHTPYYSYYASLDSDEYLSYKLGEFGIYNRELRLATEEEKLQLFDALAKKGKQWDAKKKMIVDLKQKVELKPFDKVLVRDSKSDNWRANLFSHIEKDGYYHCVSANWIYCIPYIGNESLLGTTKDVEG